MKSKYRNLYYLVFINVIVVSLSGCVSSRINYDNNIILVGEIELVPNLEPAEQDNMSALYEDWRGAADFVISSDNKPLGKHSKRNNIKRIVAPFNTTFYEVIKKEKGYYIGSYIYFEQMNRFMTRKMLLPGLIEIDVKQSDNVLYIGTIRYYRDEYNRIYNVKIVDDYEKVIDNIKFTFGENIKIRNITPKINKPEENRKSNNSA